MYVRLVILLLLSACATTAPVIPSPPAETSVVAPPLPPEPPVPEERPVLPPPEGNIIIRSVDGFLVYSNRMKGQTTRRLTIVTPTGDQIPVECDTEVDCGPVAFTPRLNGTIYQIARHQVLRYDDEKRTFESIAAFGNDIVLTDVVTPDNGAFLARFKVLEKKKVVYLFLVFQSGRWQLVKQKTPKAYAGDVYMLRRPKSSQFALYFTDNRVAKVDVEATASIVANR